MPNFIKGMWVGENALVSTVLRCSATLASQNITSLMKVNGESFLQLISSLGLMEQYQHFLSHNLWRGLCGRCGTLGSHFSDSCGVTTRRRYSRASLGMSLSASPEARRNGRSSGGKASFAFGMTATKFWDQSRATQEDILVRVYDSNKGLCRDLNRYLLENRLGWLLPTLQDMSVFNLDDLENLTEEQHRYIEEKQLTEDDLKVLSTDSIYRFRAMNAKKTQIALFHHVNRLHHLIFLSHYKLEAGTEAALMRTELEQAIYQDSGSLGHSFDEPVFLDSENLNSLEDLQNRVRNTHNLVLLLTKEVLTRPWVLIEILTAKREGTRVLLVNISKPGSMFQFPDDAFFQKLHSGRLLDEDAVNVLRTGNFSMEELEEALREVFMQIAVPYSPHKAKNIRLAEIAAVLKQCHLKSEGGPQRVKSKSKLQNEGGEKSRDNDDLDDVDYSRLKRQKGLS